MKKETFQNGAGSVPIGMPFDRLFVMFPELK